MFKEYHPSAVEIARSEVCTLLRLREAWDRPANEAQRQRVGGVAPFVSLVGAIEGDAAFDDARFLAKWRQAFREIDPPRASNLWLVFRWEGFGNTLARFPTAPQDWSAFDTLAPRSKLTRSHRYVRSVMKQALEAIAFAHEAGVAHRSVGANSIILSTLDEKRHKQVLVKLGDWGFGSLFSGILDDATIRRARKYGAFTPSQVCVSRGIAGLQRAGCTQ